MPIMSFSVPRTIYYGEGSLEKLATLTGKKAALVTGGSSMKKFGFLDQAVAILKKGGIESIIIDGVEPNPSVETVWRGAKAMLDFQPDWIVAIGGGSAIDAAKVMWCFYEHPNLTFEDIIPVGSMPPLRNKALLRCHPLDQSGTASEITAFSVITDTKNHIKYPIVAADMVPDIAILDPALPMSDAGQYGHRQYRHGRDVPTPIEAVASIAATSVYRPPTRWKRSGWCWKISRRPTTTPTDKDGSLQHAQTPRRWPAWPSPTPRSAWCIRWHTRSAASSV